MSEPSTGLAEYQSHKRVRAGEIVELVTAGCYVREASGSTILRLLEPNMLARYKPVIGDYWVVYDDGYQLISPKRPFEEGYRKVQGGGMHSDRHHVPDRA